MPSFSTALMPLLRMLDPHIDHLEYKILFYREQTQAGLKSARARGKKGGSPKSLSQPAIEKVIIAEALYKNSTIPVKKIGPEGANV